MLTDTVSDNADGLSTLSHTKTVASYDPASEGIPVSYTHLRAHET